MHECAGECRAQFLCHPGHFPAWAGTVVAPSTLTIFNNLNMELNMNNRECRGLASVIAAAMLLCTAPVQAQTSGAETGSQKSGAAATTGGSGASRAQPAGSATFGEGDKELIQDIAHANLAEIEVGKLALEKSKNDQVRKFAQTLIDDHGAAQKELEKLAQSKGLSLPQETDVQHKTISTALSALSGETFDSQFISRVGVGDHQRTHDLLRKAQKSAQMPELKSYAQKTQKVVDQHLATAKKLETRMEKKQ